jgi:hypothetical protein
LECVLLSSSSLSWEQPDWFLRLKLKMASPQNRIRRRSASAADGSSHFLALYHIGEKLAEGFFWSLRPESSAHTASVTATRLAATMMVL